VNKKLTRINWPETVLPAVRERLSKFNTRGIVPTLRAMFYALFSLNIFPNTQNYYKSLSSHTTEWRESGLLPLDCFVDQSRHVIEDFDDVYETPQEYIDRLTEHLENAGFEYSDIIPRWHNQPHYVEVWTEKNAQIGLLRSVLRRRTDDRQVRIVPGGGYSGPAFNYPNVQRLKEWEDQGKELHIVYFGDLDPSGENIEEVVIDKLAKYGLYVDFQRIAVTDEQVEQYRLPSNPDPATLEKLKRDTRANAFRRRHNGELFQVEIDALAALAPDAFRDMVLHSVDQFYDEDIRNETLDEYSHDEITKIVKRNLRKLLKKLFTG
jgi:hypothetical protein